MGLFEGDSHPESVWRLAVDAPLRYWVMELYNTGKTAQQDILPVLCPSAMNQATTLRIMERLRADEFTYEVNPGGALPLGRHGLCSMIWRRRVYKAGSQQVLSSCIAPHKSSSLIADGKAKRQWRLLGSCHSLGRIMGADGRGCI